MTGKKEENCIETLLADLKTTIRLDLEDKDDEADSQISDVYKRQARKNGTVETGNAVETPTSTKLSPTRVGYVMDIVTTPPTPCTVNPPANDNHMMASHLAQQNHIASQSLDSSLKNLRSNHSTPENYFPTQSPSHKPSLLDTQPDSLAPLRAELSRRQSNKSVPSESQSISSQCDSQLSCESVGYDSDSSFDSKTATLKRTTDFKTIPPLNMQLHQTSNRLRDPLFNSDAAAPKPRSNGTVPLSGPRASILRKPFDKDTASETTSGVSSQDMKIRFATSDSETQTSVEPTFQRSQSNPLDTLQPEEQQPNQTIFHLDKYTHLTKRKRSKGIPNVCTWFGMSAVEHLIQNTVNMSSWIWMQSGRSACNSTSGSNSTIHKTTCNSTPRTDRRSTPTSPVPSAPIMFPPVREWDSEKSLLEAMSDIGEQFLEGLSPATSKRGSRRGSQISLADIMSPAGDDKKKSKSGKRLRVPSKSDLATVKNSIIARCRSPRTIKKNNESSNGKVASQSDAKNGSVMTSALSNLSNSSDKSKDEEEEKKKEEEENNAALKNTSLLELLKEDGFGDENSLDDRKKSQRGKKSGGGGGGGRLRGGNTMMKCAMFDEVVKHAKAEDESVSDVDRRPESKRSYRQSSRLEKRLPVRDENQSLSR